MPLKDDLRHAINVLPDETLFAQMFFNRLLQEKGPETTRQAVIFLHDKLCADPQRRLASPQFRADESRRWSRRAFVAGAVSGGMAATSAKVTKNAMDAAPGFLEEEAQQRREHPEENTLQFKLGEEEKTVNLAPMRDVAQAIGSAVEQVTLMTATVAFTASSAWLMHQAATGKPETDMKVMLEELAPAANDWLRQYMDHALAAQKRRGR